MNSELIEFLVGKRAVTTPRKNEDEFAVSNPLHSTPQRNSSSSRKSKKKSIAASFYKILVQQWLDSDRFAENVLRSIVNLQDRISQEMILVNRIKYEKRPLPPWKSYGFRNNGSNEGLLTLDDINMTLDRDLLQHEAMLSQLRRMVSTMAQAQEAMGRRLSEWYADVNDDDDDDDAEKAQSMYVECAKELYRKQTMVNSVCDNLAMDIENPLLHGSDSSTAKECLNTWSLSCMESYLASKKDEINSLIKQYE